MNLGKNCGVLAFKNSGVHINNTGHAAGDTSSISTKPA
jgi:hypothetical protein